MLRNHTGLALFFFFLFIYTYIVIMILVFQGCSLCWICNTCSFDLVYVI